MSCRKVNKQTFILLLYPLPSLPPSPSVLLLEVRLKIHYLLLVNAEFNIVLILPL